ncbi:hypothetical protein [Streptomyces sp. NPDC053560]|uniref:hypothetical protein n=1 Tax=Streptomyces sp. NPDC053560 TaxID=3365711 RepID=UPI0037D33AAD
MQRRLATTLATLGTTAVLALALPGSAYAAQGTLVVDSPLGHREYVNPTGCIAVTSSALALDITNNTSGTALVFALPDCAGPAATGIEPGDSDTFVGISIKVV